MSLSKKIKEKNMLLKTLDHMESKHTVVVESFIQDTNLLEKIKKDSNVQISMTPKLVKKLKVKNKQFQNSMVGMTHMVSSHQSLQEFCNVLKQTEKKVLALQSKQLNISVEDRPKDQMCLQHKNISKVLTAEKVEKLIEMLNTKKGVEPSQHLHHTLRKSLKIDYLTHFYVCKIFGIVHGRIMGVEPMFSESQSDTLTS